MPKITISTQQGEVVEQYNISEDYGVDFDLAKPGHKASLEIDIFDAIEKAIGWEQEGR